LTIQFSQTVTKVVGDCYRSYNFFVNDTIALMHGYLCSLFMFIYVVHVFVAVVFDTLSLYTLEFILYLTHSITKNVQYWTRQCNANIGNSIML